MNSNIIVVIPAYNPDNRLVTLVETTERLFSPSFVVVDDGSNEGTRPIFDHLESHGADVLHHNKNRGKGAALKTAARHIEKHYPTTLGYVTADADYQHRPVDIRRVAAALEKNQQSLVLGVRDFCSPSVPWKSRWGNRITSAVF